MQYYFKKYAWGNNTIHQFLDALETAAPAFKARDWSKEWLETSGLNTLGLRIKCDEAGIVHEAVIQQTAPEEHKTLRNHHIQIATFDLVNGVPQLVDSWKLHVQATSETSAGANLIGKKNLFLFGSTMMTMPLRNVYWMSRHNNSL